MTQLSHTYKYIRVCLHGEPSLCILVWLSSLYTGKEGTVYVNWYGYWAEFYTLFTAVLCRYTFAPDTKPVHSQSDVYVLQCKMYVCV